MILAILGRQPAIGLAELESLIGPNNITPITNNLALINHTNLPFNPNNVGSVIKFANIIPQTATRSLPALEKYSAKFIINLYPAQTAGKIKLGFSDYSGTLSRQELLRLGLSVKKTLKKNGYSARVVPNTSPTLGSAQIIHNSLTKQNGAELIIFKQNGSLQLAHTIHEQNIEAYAARDQARPKRDARVGMLPPKLAQTIINLASGPFKSNQTLLDPFCGTGVILQEALLMGYNVYGTDIEPKMIQYSKDNLDWLKNKIPTVKETVTLNQGDATNYIWQPTPNIIASESYLGRPLTQAPSPTDMQSLISSVNTLHKKIFAHIATQITSGTRICLAVPAWHVGSRFMTLPVLDQLHNLGYNKLEFKHAKPQDLIYARADQIVGRQLVVLQKK